MQSPQRAIFSTRISCPRCVYLCLLAAQITLFGAIGAGEIPTRADIDPFLPKNASVEGPRSDHGSKRYYCYSNEGRELVAIVSIAANENVQLALLKDKKKNGVQREWYSDGQKKSESPYLNGTMDGIFKEWDKDGKLIARYTITEGNGLRQVFNSDGRIKREESFRNGLVDGHFIYVMDDGRVGIGFRNKGKICGIACDFNPNGSVSAMIRCDDNGKMSGPSIFCDHDGNVTRISYYDEEHFLSEEDYKLRAKANPNLPKYETDKNQYKNLIPQEMRDTFIEIKNRKPVKIPLEDRDEPPNAK